VLEGGKEVAADIVVSAADGHATIFEFLEGKFLNDRIRQVYSSYKPFSFLRAGIHGDRCGSERRAGILGLHLDKEIVIDPETRDDFLSFRVFHFDPTFAPAGKTAVVCFIPTYNYDYWVSLRSRDQAAYDSEKERIARAVLGICEARFPAAKGTIEVVDVATRLPSSATPATGKAAWRVGY